MTKRSKIMVVEDDQTNSMYLQLVLKKVDCDLILASNGREAIDLFRNNPDIDLILMDIRLPEINGYTATSKIRKMSQSVIIIAQTAYAFMSDKDKALEAGCNDYISKPIPKDDLLGLIAKYLKS